MPCRSKSTTCRSGRWASDCSPTCSAEWIRNGPVKPNGAGGPFRPAGSAGARPTNCATRQPNSPELRCRSAPGRRRPTTSISTSAAAVASPAPSPRSTAASWSRSPIPSSTPSTCCGRGSRCSPCRRHGPARGQRSASAGSAGASVPHNGCSGLRSRIPSPCCATSSPSTTPGDASRFPCPSRHLTPGQPPASAGRIRAARRWASGATSARIPPSNGSGAASPISRCC